MRKLVEYGNLLRPWQWIKNGVVFAGIFFGGLLFNAEALRQALEVFVLFCLLSSAVYVFNDLFDADADRQHAKKLDRPIASGAISPFAACSIIVALLLTVMVIFVATKAPVELILPFCLYLIINFAYALGAKHFPLVELFLVASGFLLRLIAGGIAVRVPPTSWILVCTGLVSLLLVVGKRRGDLAQDNDPVARRRVLATYSLPYLDALIIVLASSTIVAYLLFCTSTYGQSKFGDWVLATGVFVVFGVFRFIQIIMMNDGGDNPTALIIKDKMMSLAILGWAAVFFFIMYGSHIEK
jgi:4-hydroxybenzoate polyprenyltransferase